MIDEVIEGRDEVLFLAGSVHKILEHLTGRVTIQKSSFEAFRENIISRSKYCAERGIKYKHVIYPDKATVMRSYFPIDNIIGFTDQYRDFFTPDVIDLGLSLPDSTEHFFKTDTHLNFDGKVKTTIDVMQQFFELDAVNARVALESFRGRSTVMNGDLGSKLPVPRTEERFDIRTDFLKRYHNQAGANDGFTVVCFNKEKMQKEEGKRLLIFGDSFCERSLQFYAYFYSEILFCRTRYFHDEIVAMYKPDHLITESAERYFSHVRLDNVAPRFDLIYGLRGFKYVENVDFYRAFNAVLNFGRPQYREYTKSFLDGVR